VVDSVKVSFSSHLVWLQYELWLLFLIFVGACRRSPKYWGRRGQPLAMGRGWPPRNRFLPYLLSYQIWPQVKPSGRR